MLSRLYAKAHLLVLPSRADCTPMVAAEAMAHGTPVLASDVGGIGTVLGKGQGGHMLPLSSTPADWAQAITQITSNSDLYRHLVDASFERAHGRLSWDSWAEGILTIAKTLENAPRRRIAAA
ncbi:glycosyltransferase family 4 protein [Rhodobacteraceae bacterium]|nr:glycosyltransferase family 4 protein [Paracoccaceae bacterium]